MNLLLCGVDFISLWREWTSQGMKNGVPFGIWGEASLSASGVNGLPMA